MSTTNATLYSGAAPGAEAAFGELAEKYGLAEVNFTFEGHGHVRERGLKVLTADELLQGDVSLVYLSKLMNRRYRNTPLFKKVLQSIWHMVNSGHEVFVVGKILDDGHVRGGTGWGAEFAKLCNKRLWVFDQDADAWYHWTEGSWVKCDTPRITATDFTGTGTRALEPNGKAAIAELYAASFGS